MSVPRTRVPFLDDASWSRGSPRGQIAAAAFAILALELALIRWMSGQVRILAYFNNLILVSCFLGMGLGLLLGRRRPGLVHLTLPSLAALCAVLAFAPEIGLSHLPFPDPTIHLWGSEQADASLGGFLFALSVLLALVAAVVAVFAFAGAAIGHLADKLGPLDAYGADLLGSLLGVIAFSAATAFGATPPAWIVLGGLPLVWLSRRPVALLALVASAGLAAASARGAEYSAYNRIEVFPTDVGLTLTVNRDFHQYLHDLSRPADNLRRRLRHMYDLPFTLGTGRERALVLGAGTGNDVAAALRAGFREVYSVDIDGRIIAIGRKLHPERPYDDPRAVRVVDDARAFFHRYRGPEFDVVCFGLVDSHAMFSALSTLRLDNFVYTRQGLEAAWDLVAPDGVLTLSMSVVAGPWLERRLYWTLAEATGVKPLVSRHQLHGGVTLIATRDESRLDSTRLAAFPLMRDPPPREDVLTTSDNWPFLYLRPGTVPWGYLTVLLGLLALSAAAVVWAAGPSSVRAEFHPALFLLGAAFMLVETRGVTAASLLFGSTWIVNASVFAGVLLLALLANWAVARGHFRSVRAAFVPLLASVALLGIVNLDALNRLPLLARGLAGGVLVVLPVGFAGIVVSSLFRRVPRLAPALASNLLGSVFGGCLEYLSMVVGLRALALLAFGLYLGALLVRPRARTAGANPST